jgi:hypothetical protein
MANRNHWKRIARLEQELKPGNGVWLHFTDGPPVFLSLSGKRALDMTGGIIRKDPKWVKERDLVDRAVSWDEPGSHWIELLKAFIIAEKQFGDTWEESPLDRSE